LFNSLSGEGFKFFLVQLLEDQPFLLCYLDDIFSERGELLKEFTMLFCVAVAGSDPILCKQIGIRVELVFQLRYF